MKWLKRMPSRVDRVIVVMTIGTGLLLPWVVGVGVKLYLQARGKPTWHHDVLAAGAQALGVVSAPSTHP